MLISAKNIVLPEEVVLPLSKSESNRALMIMRYAESQSHKVVESQSVMSDSDDTVLLQKHLNTINQYIKDCEQGLLSVDCCPLTLDCHNAGTVFRFLMTAVAMQCTMNNLQCTIYNEELTILLTGSDRMKQRPIDSLVDALRSLGVSIEYAEKECFPPILIKSPIIELPTDYTDLHRCYSSKTDARDLRRLEISVEQSSQFASSLLLAAPLWKNGLELHLTGNLSSLPYIDMTINMMRACGIDVVRNERVVKVNPGEYNCDAIKIEPDWSAAAFWYEIVALSDNSEVLLKNLNINSLQADATAIKVFKELGVETIVDKEGVVVRKTKGERQTAKVLVQSSKFNSHSSKFNFQHCPDLFPAVIATCAGLCIDAEFSGLKNLSIKESDRKQAMIDELTKTNISFEIISDDILRMRCPKELPYFTEENPIVFNNYGDHRIAMALAPLAMKVGFVEMENTEVVSKSYPGFFEEFTIDS